MRVASFDIGSNTALCLLAERGPDGRWSRLGDQQRICRISEGLDRDGLLAEGPIARTEAALCELAAWAREASVDRILATGTAPFRRATNGPEVAQRLGRVLGAPLDVVSGEEEARLSLLSTRAAFPDVPAFLVVDIGGASTEIVHAASDGTWQGVSLDVGSVRLTERLVASHPIHRDQQDALRATVNAQLDRADVRPLLQPGLALVGIAGTVTTLAAAALEMDTWDADRVHGWTLSRRALAHLAAALPNLSVAQRARLAGISPKRADVIAAGALLLDTLVERMGADGVVVSDRGVRWGRLETLTREGGARRG